MMLLLVRLNIMNVYGINFDCLIIIIQTVETPRTLREQSKVNYRDESTYSSIETSTIANADDEAFEIVRPTPAADDINLTKDIFFEGILDTVRNWWSAVRNYIPVGGAALEETSLRLRCWPQGACALQKEMVLCCSEIHKGIE
jgi:hypothetical protein